MECPVPNIYFYGVLGVLKSHGVDLDHITPKTLKDLERTRSWVSADLITVMGGEHAAIVEQIFKWIATLVQTDLDES